MRDPRGRDTSGIFCVYTLYFNELFICFSIVFGEYDVYLSKQILIIMLHIEKVEKSSEFILESVSKLISQLTSGDVYFTKSDIDNIISSECSNLYLLYNDDIIVGMFTLAHYITPTGKKYWLEDVVISEDMRGQSLGKRMVEEAIRIVSKDGKSKLMLTSKPSRIVANKLYQSVGFQKKETNVYKMDFDK